jgi:hypothetical protein
VTATAPVALSAPGLFHRMPVTGHPHAGHASLLNGHPTVPLFLGKINGALGEIEFDFTSLTDLEALEFAVRQARNRLQDLMPRPLGGAA